MRRRNGTSLRRFLFRYRFSAERRRLTIDLATPPRTEA
jgi:hypothetical protein